MKIFSCISAFMLIAMTIFGQKNVDIRMVQKGIDQKANTISLEIQVRNSDYSDLNLGGYNMRLYYNSHKLSLKQDGISSLLNGTKYTETYVNKDIKQINASGFGQLDYDDDMGFISFSANLKDKDAGGDLLKENSEWTSLASLQFDINEKFDNEEVITFARADKTGEYATAFVEMVEWIGSSELLPLDVSEYQEQIEGFNSIDGDYVNIVVGPNPTSDFVNVNLEKAINSDAIISIVDASGSQVFQQRMRKGSVGTTLDIGHLPSSVYLVEIHNGGSTMISKKIVKVN